MPRKTPHASAGGALAPALLAFGAIFAGLWLVHAPLLRLPYFWDEAGYFIPAARDILLTGDLIPHTTLSNAHPPLVMLWLALCWKLTAYTPLVTRTAMLLVAGFGFTGLWLLGRRVASAPVATCGRGAYRSVAHGVFTVGDGATGYRGIRPGAVDAVLAHLRTALAGDCLCGPGGGGKGDHGGRHADLVWRRPAGLVRLPVVAGGGRQSGACRGAPWRRCAAYLLALLPLVGWYAYHFHRTGHVFGNPDYLRYNVGATVTPLRIVLAGLMRLWHVTGYMNLFVLTSAALLVLWDARRMPTFANRRQMLATKSRTWAAKREVGRQVDDSAPAIPANVQLLLALVVLAQVAEFSVVGGALLARYMIPAIPLVVLAGGECAAAICAALAVVGRGMRGCISGRAVLQSAVVHLAGRQPDLDGVSCGCISRRRAMWKQHYAEDPHSDRVAGFG